MSRALSNDSSNGFYKSFTFKSMQGYTLSPFSTNLPFNAAPSRLKERSLWDL